MIYVESFFQFDNQNFVLQFQREKIEAQREFQFDK